jgi:hypothetical protein
MRTPWESSLWLNTAFALMAAGAVPGVACRAQDKHPIQPEEGVRLQIGLATPFFISGMKVELQGKISNPTNTPIRIVPPASWHKIGGWDEADVNLHTLSRERTYSDPVPERYSVEIGPGKDHVFFVDLGEYYAKDEKKATARLAILYRQNDKVKHARSECEFEVTRYEDVKISEKERLSEPGPETKWTSDPLKVKIGKIRMGEKYFLVARCLWKKERGWVAFMTSIVDEVHKDTDFILGALPDLKVRLCYERGDALVQVDLSAWTGQPVVETKREEKKSEK